VTAAVAEPEGNPVRVGYVCAGTVPVFGSKGESIHVQEMARAMTRSGAEVDLVAERVAGEPPVGFERVRVHRIPRARVPDRRDRERAALAANDAVVEKLAELGPFDLVYERYSLWSYAGMKYARAAGVPGILEVNGPRVEETAARGDLIDRAAAEEVAVRAIEASTAVVAVSEEVARYVREKVAGDDRVHVVPNGVDPRRFPDGLLERRRSVPRPFTVGWVGWFRPFHGFDTLIDAFAEVRKRREARLLLVGDGPRREAVEGRLEALGLRDAAEVCGSITPSEVPAQLVRMDVGVAIYDPALQSHASPLKVLEYLAAGLPVVASGASQLEHLLDHGERGLLCAPDDPGALAVLIERLAGDERLRHRLGAAGRRHVLTHHTWDQVAGRVFELAGLTVRR